MARERIYFRQVVRRVVLVFLAGLRRGVIDVGFLLSHFRAALSVFFEPMISIFTLPKRRLCSALRRFGFLVIPEWTVFPLFLIR